MRLPRRFEVLRAAVFGHELVDHRACDADPRREHREVIDGVPTDVFYLFGVLPKLATDVICCKTDHQGVRERPRLTPEVSQVRNLDPHLLAYLPIYGLLYRLAGLDETGQHAVHTRREARRTGEQDPVSVSDQHDSRRAQSWVEDHATPGALFGEGFRPELCLRSAPAAEPVRPGPLADPFRPPPPTQEHTLT